MGIACLHGIIFSVVVFLFFYLSFALDQLCLRVYLFNNKNTLASLSLSIYFYEYIVRGHWDITCKYHRQTLDKVQQSYNVFVLSCPLLELRYYA